MDRYQGRGASEVLKNSRAPLYHGKAEPVKRRAQLLLLFIDNSKRQEAKVLDRAEPSSLRRITLIWCA